MIGPVTLDSNLVVLGFLATLCFGMIVGYVCRILTHPSCWNCRKMRRLQ